MSGFTSVDVNDISTPTRYYSFFLFFSYFGRPLWFFFAFARLCSSSLGPAVLLVLSRIFNLYSVLYDAFLPCSFFCYFSTIFWTQSAPKHGPWNLFFYLPKLPMDQNGLWAGALWQKHRPVFCLAEPKGRVTQTSQIEILKRFFRDRFVTTGQVFPSPKWTSCNGTTAISLAWKYVHFRQTLDFLDRLFVILLSFTGPATWRHNFLDFATNTGISWTDGAFFFMSLRSSFGDHLSFFGNTGHRMIWSFGCGSCHVQDDVHTG